MFTTRAVLSKYSRLLSLIVPKKQLYVYNNVAFHVYPMTFNLRPYSLVSNTPITYSIGVENAFALNVVDKTLNKDLVYGEIIKDLPTALERLKDETLKEGEWELISSEIKSNITSYSVNNLVAIFRVLRNHQTKKGFSELFDIIDKEGSKVSANGDPELLLAGCLNIFLLNKTKESYWVWQSLRRFCRRLNNLKTSQVVQLMFMVNVCRKFPSQHTQFDIQHYLVEHFDHLDLDQMAIVAIAFFKSQTKLRNSVIMSKMMRKLVDEAETSNSFSVGMLCKIIRYSLPLTLADELLILQSKFVHLVPQLDVKCLTHIALSGTSVLLFNEELIRAVINRLRNDLQNVRLKDLERIVFVMSLYNVIDDDFIRRVIQAVDNMEDQIKAYPKALICLVNYLIVLQHYHVPLIDRVLSKQYLSETYKSSYRKIGIELIYIDKSVEIEAPHYVGNRLSPDMLKSSAKVSSFRERSDTTATQKFAWTVENMLHDLLGGQSKVAYATILPHFHYPDVLIGFDDAFKPQTIDGDWRIHRWGEIKPLPDSTSIWMPIIVGGWNTVIRNSGQPLGTMVAKIRQLRLLGFHPILLKYTEWKTINDKENYLKEIINTNLKEITEKKKASSNIN